MWLFWLIQIGLLVLVAESFPRKCDPFVHRLWYAVPNNPNVFIFCHPVKRKFFIEKCLHENGVQKQFVPSLQQCVLQEPESTTTIETTTAFQTRTETTRASVRKHPIYSRYSAVANLKTVGQSMVMTNNGSGATSNSIGTTSEQHSLTGPVDLVKCPMGRVALHKRHSNDPIVCEAHVDQDVPGINECGESREFTCTFPSATASRGICCQRSPNSEMRCPSQMRPLIEADGTVRPCSPVRIGLCRGSGTMCVFNEKYGDFYCCEPEAAPRRWDVEPKSGFRSSTMTSILVIKQSPTFRLRKQPLIRVNEEKDGCLKGEAAFKHVLTKFPLICGAYTEQNAPASPSCPVGFRCYHSRSAGQSQCCGFNSGHCPANSAALTMTKMGAKPKVVTCGPLSGCPQDYFCNEKTRTCCSIEPMRRSCEHGLALAHSDRRTVRCTNSNCPIGYACNQHLNQTFCCPTAELICAQPVNKGLFCVSAQPKRYYFYHPSSGECRPFVHLGCSKDPSNIQNRFKSQIQCEDLCRLTQVCPLGEAPLRTADGLLANCTDDSNCPNNFNCLTTFQGNYCCPTTETSDVCPDSTSPHLFRQKPIECRSTRDCMPSYECVRNEKYLLGYCCSKNRRAIPVEPKQLSINSNCADGTPPLQTPDGEPQICVPNKILECPSDFQCELNSYFGRYQCCSSNATDSTTKEAVCPQGTSIQMHPQTSNPVQCSLNTDCANFAQCETQKGICCEANNLEALLKITQQSRIKPGFFSGLMPGQTGCISDNQCAINFPGSFCFDWVCRCPPGMLSFQFTCIKECPEDYHERESACAQS